jgi:hypothetical protein
MAGRWFSLDGSHFFFNRRLQFVGGPAKFCQSLAQGFTQLWQFLGPENDQSDYENNDEFGNAERTHFAPPK